MCMAARSNRPEENEEESATLAAMTAEGDCVLTSAWSGTSTIVDTAKTIKGFSVLIDGGPRSMALSQTNLCNKQPFPVKSVCTSMCNGVCIYKHSPPSLKFQKVFIYITRKKSQNQ